MAALPMLLRPNEIERLPTHVTLLAEEYRSTRSVEVAPVRVPFVYPPAMAQSAPPCKQREAFGTQAPAMARRAIGIGVCDTAAKLTESNKLKKITIFCTSIIAMNKRELREERTREYFSVLKRSRAAHF